MYYRIPSCPLCGKLFNTKSALDNHQNTHTGIKPYQCEKCDKYFSQEVNLKTHHISHTEDKPFACSQCSKVFSRKQILRNHSKTHASRTKDHACLTCSKRFFSIYGEFENPQYHSWHKGFFLFALWKGIFSKRTFGNSH